MRSVFGGNEWVQQFVPVAQIEALPMRLLRSQLYPGRPDLVVQGIDEYRRNLSDIRADRYRAPEMFPIRITQNQHKHAPASMDPRGPVTSAYMALHGRPGARGVTAMLAHPGSTPARGAYLPQHFAPRFVGAGEISDTIGPDMRPILRAQAARAERVAGPQALHDPRATRSSRNLTEFIRARNAARAPLDSATRHLLKKARIGR